LDINVYNGAIGGASSALRENIGFPFQSYSFAMVSKFFQYDNSSYFENGAKDIAEERITYIEEPIRVLKSVDADALDYIIICYGTNDYFNQVPIESNWPQGEEAYKNSLSNGIERIKKRCPDAQILLCSPIYGNYEERDDFSGDSNTLDLGYGTLRAYVTAMEEVANEQGVVFINAYDGLGLNADNWTKYYYNDGVHPNMAGCRLYTELVAGYIEPQ